MSAALASAWQPRGELPRLVRLLPAIRQVYAAVAISLPPGADPGLVAELAALADTRAVVTPDWSWGRHAALKLALESPAEVVHLADLDRLLRWVETRPQEWRRVVQGDLQVDCLIVGRTAAAYATHPQALARTEAISNRVTSYLLGMAVDASAGYRCFSRAAAEFLICHSSPGDALGMDAAWPVLLRRAGYRVETIAVDGLDWEIPDQYQDRAAGAGRQAQLAEVYDRDPEMWARRVEVALEIVCCGLEAASQPIERSGSE